MSIPSLPPLWSPVLQGLSFWIGHRYEKFSNHPLVEGAIVGEMCNLISSKIGSSQRLLCETKYSRIIGSGNDRRLADLTISSNETKPGIKHKLSSEIESVVEVKRYSQSLKAIYEDMRKLLELKRANSTPRTFLVLVAQRTRPETFVSEEGKARRDHFDIPDENGEFRVRTVKKAAKGFDSYNYAHYSCLIEVFKSTDKFYT